MADGSLPSSADLAAAISAGHVASDPEQLAGASAQPAPGGPVYDPELDVGLNADGSVAYVPNPNGKGVTVSSDAQGVLVSSDPADTTAGYSSDPGIVQAYIKAHPEVQGAKPPGPAQGTSALPSDDDLRQAIEKNGFTTDPADGAASGQAPAKTPDVPLGAAGAGMAALANAATLGFGRKAAAAINTLLDGGLSDFGQRYSQNMDAYQALDQQAWHGHPAAVAAGTVAGTLTSGLALPEVEGATWGARALSGARQGAVLGALEGAGNARGGVDKWVPAAVEGAGTGLVTGGALGGWLGARTPREALDPDLLHMPPPTAQDYATAETSPIAAVGGPETLQRIGQILAGTPLAGAPLQAAARKWGAQTAAKMAKTIGAYGEAASPEEAGAAISDANQRILDRIAAEQQAAAQAVAQKGAGAANAREAGEQVQGAVQRFASGDDGQPSAPLAQPTRATSFADKSKVAYDRAFTRIGQEMAATRAQAATASQGAKLHEALFQDTGMAPTGKAAIASTSPHIDPTETRAVVKSILRRSQSPHVKGLLEAPQVQRVAAAVGEPEKLSFDDLRNLRTWVRYAQRNQELRQTIGDADLQRMEKALTQDIYANAERLASPGAAQQLKRADQYYRLGSTRIKEALSTFANAPAGERAFDRILTAASSGPQGDIQRLTALRKSLRPEEWRSVAKSAIMRMGEGSDGFDLERFVAGFDKLSPEGREALFGARSVKLNQELQSLAERGRSALDAKPDLHFGANKPPTPAAAFQGLLAAAQRKGKAANVAAIEALRQAVPGEQWGDVAASVLHELGRRGEGFSLTHFATNWSKLSDGGKAALFGGEGREGEVASLNALAKLGAQEARAAKFYNHSNSGHQATGMMALFEAAEGLMSGDHEKLIAMGVAMTGGRLAAHLLAEPGFSRLMVRMHTAESPEAIKALARRMGSWLKAHPDEAAVLQRLAAGATRVRRNAPVTLGVSAAIHRQNQLREAAPSALAQ